YSFSHPLIQETLTGQLLASRRMRLHRQVGEALEQLYAANLEPHLAELAHHFVQAAPGGDVEKAVSYAVRAAERSRALLAYGRAARLYETALQALTLREGQTDPARCTLLLGLAEAQTPAAPPAPAP